MENGKGADRGNLFESFKSEGRTLQVVDTSGLIHNPAMLFNTPDDKVLVVIGAALVELDRQKTLNQSKGVSARAIIRDLDHIVSSEKVQIVYPQDKQSGWLFVASKNLLISFSPSSMVSELVTWNDKDGLFIEAVRDFRRAGLSCELITQDIMLRLRAQTCGITVLDAFEDDTQRRQTQHDEIDTYEETFLENVIHVDATDDYTITQDFYGAGGLNLNRLAPFLKIPISEVRPHTMFYVKCGSDSFAAVENNGVLIRPNVFFQTGTRGYDSEQDFALWALTNPDIDLVMLTGRAGTGKTHITMSVALTKVLNEMQPGRGMRTKKSKSYTVDQFEKQGTPLKRTQPSRVILTRILEGVGKTAGLLKGTLEEKLDPWYGSARDAWSNLCKSESKADSDYFDIAIQEGSIEIASFEHIRGRTFNNCTIILDEAQNARPSEIKTLITRAGEGSKVILLGDIDQIDPHHLDKHTNGLSMAIKAFAREQNAMHIHMTRCYRSKLANQASKLL